MVQLRRLVAGVVNLAVPPCVFQLKVHVVGHVADVCTSNNHFLVFSELGHSWSGCDWSTLHRSVDVMDLIGHGHWLLDESEVQFLRKMMIYTCQLSSVTVVHASLFQWTT